MSYQRMDHAKWVEDENAAINCLRKGKSARLPLPEKLTEFQAKVMDILGMVFGGIYNAPINWERSVEWKVGRGMSVVLSHSHGMSTFDFSELTRLVFLCHEARIRGSIQPAARTFRLLFSPRTHEGNLSERHPNLEEAVAEFHRYLPHDHRVIYRAQCDRSPTGADATGGSVEDESAVATNGSDAPDPSPRLSVNTTDIG